MILKKKKKKLSELKIINLFEMTLYENFIINNRISDNSNLINIINIIFIFCSSPNSSGGAIYCSNSLTNLNIISSLFISCISYSYGGSIRFTGSNFELNNTCFYNNTNLNNYGSCFYSSNDQKYKCYQTSASNCPGIHFKSLHCCFLPQYGDQTSIYINISFNNIRDNSGLHHWNYKSSTIKYHLSSNHLCGTSLGISNPINPIQEHKYISLINSTNDHGQIFCSGHHIYISESIFLKSISKIFYEYSSSFITITNCYFEFDNNIIGSNIISCFKWNSQQTILNNNFLNTYKCNNYQFSKNFENSKKIFKILFFYNFMI